MGEWITTKQAMEILGVGSTTIKRWADQGIFPHIRTPGGHRRFSRVAIERLQIVGVDNAVDKNEARRWVQWLRTEDVPFITHRIERLHSDCENWFTVADFLGTVVAEVGEFWADDVFSVVDEHIATARLTQALSALSGTFGVKTNERSGLLAAPSGDDHTLGLALTQLCMRSEGIDALMVGASTPTAELLLCIREWASDLEFVALSASRWSTDAVTLRRTCDEVASACSEKGIKLFVGGEGAWPEVLDYGSRLHAFEGLQSALRK